MYLFYGKYSALQYIPNTFKVFNFSSFKEIGIAMNLMPPNTLGAINEYDFDCRYAQYLISVDQAFYNMMNLIMSIYNNEDVFILINDEEDSFFGSDSNWSAILIESFLKFIQQRYGLNATYIQSSDDVSMANVVDFSDYGVMNLDIDKERWSMMTEYNRIVINGGTPNV